jgi:hypothetical protein
MPAGIQVKMVAISVSACACGLSRSSQLWDKGINERLWGSTAGIQKG